MDFVSRLKQFIEKEGLSVSQFADSAGIPRPTLSQILNGRNKTINNEFIGKIHAAYPNLNIVWLLFGDGDPSVDKNIEISEPENSGKIDDGINEVIDFESTEGLFSLQTRNDEKVQSKSTDTGKVKSDQTKDNLDFKRTVDLHLPHSIISGENQRKVISIMVFYSDNSFESFVPQKS